MSLPLNLLEKTELWINNIRLDNTNLTDLATCVADVLGLDHDKVLVVDVRDMHVTLDVLQQDIPQENLLGKQTQLLDAVAALPGVTLSEEAFVHSNGILGLICLEDMTPEQAQENNRLVGEMADEIRTRIAKRALVFPTGFEVKRGLIEDTNTPFLQDYLTKHGYQAAIGKVVDDDIDSLAFRMSDAVSQAYGLIISTGGVGAEDKDKSVEALLMMDPQAATPYIVKFTQGEGRHVKDGVRIGVGQVGPSLIVTLPGPNDEVRLAAQTLIQCLNDNADKHTIAARLARTLADRWAEKTGLHAKHHGSAHHHHEEGYDETRQHQSHG